MRITARGLAKAFEGRPVLEDVCLSVEHPGIYALVGPNGSGKTTLMRLLTLLERPDSGAIEIDGLSVFSDSKGYADLRRRLVLVHNPAVMLSGTVLYNAEYGLKVRGWPRGQRLARLAEWLERMSLSGCERRQAKTLSAGEAQRLALVRALAVDPEAIFLDEPTANLDPLSAGIIERTIEELGRSGRTVVLASHHLWQVERLADWIWFLNNGRIELSGPAQQVLHQGDRSFWSRFLGRDNLFVGIVKSFKGRRIFDTSRIKFEVVAEWDGRALASLNPGEIILSLKPLLSSARNVIPGRITNLSSRGGLYKVAVDIGEVLYAVVTRASAEALKLKVGKKVYVVFKASAVRVWREEQ